MCPAIDSTSDPQISARLDCTQLLRSINAYRTDVRSPYLRCVTASRRINRFPFGMTACSTLPLRSLLDLRQVVSSAFLKDKAPTFCFLHGLMREARRGNFKFSICPEMIQNLKSRAWGPSLPVEIWLAGSDGISFVASYRDCLMAGPFGRAVSESWPQGLLVELAWHGAILQK